jgi:hypothetical protein
MKKFPTLMTLAVLAPMLASCTPAPAKVCEHVIAVSIDRMQKELLLQKERGEEIEAMPNEEELAQAVDACMRDLAKAKEKDASAYKKRASCAMAAKTVEDLEQCR